MSNSPLVNYIKHSPNQSGKRTHVIDRITPHCVVGQCSVEVLGNVFAASERRASSNYGIGVDGRIALFVDEDNRSWCSSSALNDDRAVTIECASDTTYPWAFREIVYERLVELCIDICKRNGKNKLLWINDRDKAIVYEPKADEMLLTVHRWFANKSCPGDWMMDRMDDLASKVTRALAPKEPEHWYDGAMEWVESNGIMLDGRPNDSLTRAEMATMLMRYHAKFGKDDAS